MRKLMVAVIAALAGAAGLVSAAFGADPIARTYVVNNGETLTIGGTMGADAEHNNRDALIDLQGGATLVITNAQDSRKSAYLWSTLVATNGPATMVLGDTSQNYIGRSDIIVRGEGSLVIKSKQCRNFSFASDSSASSNWPQVDVSNVSYRDENGNPYTEVTTNSFAKMTILGWPDPNANVKVSYTDGDYFYLAGSNMFDRVGTFCRKGDRIVLDKDLKVGLYLLSTNALGSMPVTLGENWRSLILKPCLPLDFATTHVRTWTSTEGAVYNLDVEMYGKEAKISSQSQKNIVVTGRIAGNGKISADQPSADSPRMTLDVQADLSSFTGSVFVSKKENMKIKTGFVSGMVNLYHQAQLSFATEEEGGADMVEVPSVTLITTEDQPAMVLAAAGQTVKLGEISGYLTLMGDPEDETDTIDIAGVGEEPAYLQSDGSVNVTFNNNTAPAAYVAPAGLSAWFLPNMWNDVLSIPQLFARPATSNAIYTVHGDVTVKDLPFGCELKAVGGSAVKLEVDENSFVGAKATDSLKLVAKPFNWRKEAILWLDPSDETTIFKHYKRATVEPGNKGTKDLKQPLTPISKTDGNDSGLVVEGMADKRGTKKTTLRVWNGRSYQNFTRDLTQDNSGYEELESVFPFLSSYATDGKKTYLAFGEYKSSGARRLQFVDFTADVNPTNAQSHYTTIAPKFAVIVYGSQLGGGYSMLGSTELERSDKMSTGEMLNKTRDVWVNGKLVDPTTEKFSGKMDVISLDLSDGSEIKCLGGRYGSVGNDSGGKYLGEMLFFDRKLTDAERIEVERYLATAWDIDYAVADPVLDVSANIAGAGTLEVEANVSATVSGFFAGTLSIGAGSTVTFAANAAKPYSEADIEALNPVFWVDPDQEGVIDESGVGAGLVYRLFQHDPTKRTVGTDIMLTSCGGGRAPAHVRSARLYGPERTWIDYNGINERASSNNGNTLRMRNVASDSTSTKPSLDTNVLMRTGFIVQDSERGGGTPFLDTISGNKVQKRTPHGDYSSAMYASETSSLLKDGSVSLNGETVNYENGFTGGPEVYGFTATDDFPVGQFAYYGNSQDGNTGKYGEFESEIILFSALLSDEVRKGVSAYLMRKWLGCLPTGYMDFTGATVTGAGTVAAKSAADLPTFAAGFTGAVQLTESSDFAFTYKDKAIADALDFGGGSYAFADGAKVTVTVATRRRPGKYTLITAGSLTGTVRTLELMGENANIGNREHYSLAIEENKLVLTVKGSGLIVIAR